MVRNNHNICDPAPGAQFKATIIATTTLRLMQVRLFREYV